MQGTSGYLRKQAQRELISLKKLLLIYIRRGWGIPLLAQINIHEWKQWLQGMGGTLQKQLMTLCSPQENDTVVSSPYDLSKTGNGRGLVIK